MCVIGVNRKLFEKGALPFCGNWMVSPVPSSRMVVRVSKMSPCRTCQYLLGGTQSNSDEFCKCAIIE